MASVKKASSSEIKKINRNLVFGYLYEHESVTKQVLAQRLGISMPTVTQNLAELTEKGLIRSLRTLDSTGGRRARVIEINGSAKIAVGLDITARDIGVVIANLTGEIIYQKRVKAPFCAKKAYFFTVAAAVEKALDDIRLDRSGVLGVGIAVPAIVSTDGRSLKQASVIDFTNGQLSDFAEYIPYKCMLFNDATMGCYAEYWKNADLRASLEERSVVYLSVSDSVGGAFMLNGAVYGGMNLRASEFGHMTIVPDGRKCYCGQYGCADAYLAAGVLSGGVDGKLDEFFSKLESGDKKANEAWDKYVYYLALVVKNLRMAYDCDIIIGGRVGGYIAPYMQSIRSAVARRDHFDADASFLRPCACKQEATGAGAALIFINNFIKTI